MKSYNIEWDGINRYAEHENGVPFNEEELEALNNEDNYDLLLNYIY